MKRADFDTVKIGDIVSIAHGTYEGRKYIVRYIEDESIMGKYLEYLGENKGYYSPKFKVAHYQAWNITN